MAKQKTPNSRRANLEERGVLSYAAVTKDAAERRSWTFCEAIKVEVLRRGSKKQNLASAVGLVS
jgi:hypothetical protein